MSQIPVRNETFIGLNLLKAAAVTTRGGQTTTWDEIVEALITISKSHEQEFLELIQKSGEGKNDKLNKQGEDV